MLFQYVWNGDRGICVFKYLSLVGYSDYLTSLFSGFPQNATSMFVSDVSKHYVYLMLYYYHLFIFSLAPKKIYYRHSFPQMTSRNPNFQNLKIWNNRNSTGLSFWKLYMAARLNFLLLLGQTSIPLKDKPKKVHLNTNTIEHLLCARNCITLYMLSYLTTRAFLGWL